MGEKLPHKRPVGVGRVEELRLPLAVGHSLSAEDPGDFICGAGLLHQLIRAQVCHDGGRESATLRSGAGRRSLAKPGSLGWSDRRGQWEEDRFVSRFYRIPDKRSFILFLFITSCRGIYRFLRIFILVFGKL